MARVKQLEMVRTPCPSRYEAGGAVFCRCPDSIESGWELNNEAQTEARKGAIYKDRANHMVQLVATAMRWKDYPCGASQIPECDWHSVPFL